MSESSCAFLSLSFRGCFRTQCSPLTLVRLLAIDSLQSLLQNGLCCVPSHHGPLSAQRNISVSFCKGQFQPSLKTLWKELIEFKCVSQSAASVRTRHSRVKGLWGREKAGGMGWRPSYGQFWGAEATLAQGVFWVSTPGERHQAPFWTNH